MTQKIKNVKYPYHYPFQLSEGLYRRAYHPESSWYTVKFLLVEELRTWLYENKIDCQVFAFFDNDVYNSELGDEIHEYYNGFPSISFNSEENAVFFMLTFGGNV